MADTIPADNSASSLDTVEPRALLPASTATAASAPAGAAAPADSAAPAQPSVQAPSHSGGVKSFHLLVLLIVSAITGVGSLMLLASAMQPTAAGRREPSASTGNAVPNAAQATPAAAPVVATGAAEPAVKSAEREPLPKWQVSTNARKAGYGANIVFELAADSDVEVWRKRTRPVLTMRCAARTTEVFVITNAPATIEGNSNRHTVKIAFDGHQPVEQSWEHSIDHDALFAPDGASMMRRITAARTMSFSFEPFNAPPATVTFSVEGFDAHRKAAAGKCRP